MLWDGCSLICCSAVTGDRIAVSFFILMEFVVVAVGAGVDDACCVCDGVVDGAAGAGACFAFVRRDEDDADPLLAFLLR